MNDPAVARTRETAIRRLRGIPQPSDLEGAFFLSSFLLQETVAGTVCLIAAPKSLS